VSAVPQWMRELPNGKRISALGFGCSSVWAKSTFDATLAQQVLEAASAEGVNYFDTSPSYGLGVGEDRLSTFLTEKDMSQLVISTKVGSNLVNGSVARGFGYDEIRRSFDESLKRLNRDHVDILYLHGPAQEDLNDTVFKFLEMEKNAGRISYSGVNSFDHDILLRTAASPIDAAMIQYNVGDFRLKQAMLKLHQQGKIVISGTALARAQFDLKTFFPKDFKSVWYLARMARQDLGFVLHGRRLAKALSKFGPNPYETAVKFVTGQCEILSNLFGSTDPHHVRANVQAAKQMVNPLLNSEMEIVLRKVALT
jgi:D-threo-aldose 1-dehydrogenase